MEGAFGLVVADGGVGFGVAGGALHLAQRHALEQSDGDVGAAQRVGGVQWVIPAVRARRRMIAAALWGRMRLPHSLRSSGPSLRSPIAVSTACWVRGLSTTSAGLSPLPSTCSVGW